MIVSQGQNKSEIYESGTYNGLMFNCYLIAAVANTALVNADFLPEYVSVKVQLLRNGNLIDMMNDNAKVLSYHNMINNNFSLIYNGIDAVYPAAGVSAIKWRSAFLRFGSPVCVGRGEKLIVTINFNATALSAAASATSYIDFYAKPTIGYEWGVGITKARVVQANITNEQYPLGDNLLCANFLNLDQNTMNPLVVSTIQLQSDRLTRNLQAYEFYIEQQIGFENSRSVRYITGVTAATLPPAISEALNYLPQCARLFGAMPDSTTEKRFPKITTKASAMITYNGANVNASQNFVVDTSLIINEQNMMLTQKKMATHLVENFGY